MDFAKMGQNLGQSLTGNISKAILCIRKTDQVSVQKKSGKKEGIDSIGPEEQRTIDDISGESGLNSKLMKLADKTLNGGRTASFDDVKGKAESKNFIALELQYNPSSIRLDTTAGRQMTYGGGAGSTQVQQYTPPASTTLSCELLFDDCNNMDAFMLADNPLTGATASNIKNTATSMYKNLAKDGYSVQRQMEGLLSLLTVPAARHVIFYWGSMCFRGELTEVTTKYTMFNKKGYPIRGTMSIQIRQGDGSAEAQDPDAAYKYDESHWLSAFDKTFTPQGAGQAGWKSATNNSIMNLKL